MDNKELSRNTLDFLLKAKDIYSKKNNLYKIFDERMVLNQRLTLNYKSQCGSEDEFTGIIINSEYFCLLKQKEIELPDTIPIYSNKIKIDMNSLSSFSDRHNNKNQNTKHLNSCKNTYIKELKELFENEMLPFYEIYQIYIDISEYKKITDIYHDVDGLLFLSDGYLVAQIRFETNEKYVVGVSKLLIKQIQDFIDFVTRE